MDKDKAIRAAKLTAKGMDKKLLHQDGPLSIYKQYGDTYIAEHNGQRVGEMNLSSRAPYATRVEVHPDFRRMGIASKLYDVAESDIGRKMMPSPLGLSDDATKMWKKRLNNYDDMGQRADIVREAVNVGRAAGVGKSAANRMMPFGYDPETEKVKGYSTGGAMELARAITAKNRAGGQIAPSKYMPNVPRAVHADGGRENGADGITAYHASPENIVGQFRPSARDVGIHFAANPDLAHNAAVKSLMGRPDMAEKVSPKAFKINARPEQIVDIPAASNRFDFYDILDHLHGTGRIDSDTFNKTYDGLQDIENRISHPDETMKAQNVLFSKALSKSNIKALRYMNNFDAGPTWKDMEEGRMTSFVTPDHSYIVTDPSAIQQQSITKGGGGNVEGKRDFTQDNPGGEWLEGKQARAAQYPDRKFVAGAITGVIGGRSSMFLPTHILKGIAGMNDETRTAGVHKYDNLLSDAQKGGFDHDQKGNKVVVAVNHYGQPYLLEGNTRVAVAHTLGIPKVKAEVRYWNGAENVDGPMHPDRVFGMASDTPDITKADGGPVGKAAFQEGNHPLVPDVLYHGSIPRIERKGWTDEIDQEATDRNIASQDFRAFKPSEYGNYGAGIYLSDSPKVASDFAQGIRGESAEARPHGQVFKLHVSMKNPFTDSVLRHPAWKDYIKNEVKKALWLNPTNSNNAKESSEQLIQKLDDGTATVRDLFLRDTPDGTMVNQFGQHKIHQTIRNSGFDGIIAHRPDGSKEYVAFKPEQVKSAIGNNGNFDPTDPDITKAGGGAITVQSKDGSGIFGDGAMIHRYVHPETGSHIEVLERRNGPASVLGLEVPEEHRGKGIGQMLQAEAMERHPALMGQVSSKAAATTAYRLGRRPYSASDASLEDVFSAIDRDSSVNMLSPQAQPKAEGGRVTDTDEFRNWFGNSVTHTNGEPHVLYTGTSKDKDFTSHNVGRHGAWFVRDPEAASSYAEQNDSQGYKQDGWKLTPTNTASRVIPAYVKAENPYTGELPEEYLRDNYKAAQSDWFDTLRAKGHDSWVPASQNGNLVVALKEPQQIKSIWNNGKFDPKEKHMNKAEGGEVDNNVTNLSTVRTKRDIMSGDHSYGAQNMFADLADKYAESQKAFDMAHASGAFDNFQIGDMFKYNGLPNYDPEKIVGFTVKHVSSSPNMTKLFNNHYPALEFETQDADRKVTTVPLEWFENNLHKYDKVGGRPRIVKGGGGEIDQQKEDAVQMEEPANGMHMLRMRKAGINTKDDFWNRWRDYMRAKAGPNPNLSMIGSKDGHFKQIDDMLKFSREAADQNGIRNQFQKYGNKGVGPDGKLAASMPRAIFQNAGVDPTIDNASKIYHSLPDDESGRIGFGTGGTPDQNGELNVGTEIAPNDNATRPQAGELPNAGGIRGGAGVLQTQNEAPLEGLPQKIVIPLTGQIIRASADPRIRQVARDYMAQSGLPYSPPTKYAKVDPKRAARIASDYTAMEDNPNDPLTKASYDAMIKETMDQYRAAKKSGLNIEFWNPRKQEDPYKASPRLATEDIRNNHHMWVFPTYSGYGSGEPISEDDAKKNPLLQLTGEKWNGIPVTVNDVFRAIHDYYGHAKEGLGFRADGEENAWRAHAAMFSPLARMAMTSETRGQNSWLNYGPHGEHNRKARTEDTIFAPQKIGVLSHLSHHEGAEDFIKPEEISLMASIRSRFGKKLGGAVDAALALTRRFTKDGKSAIDALKPKGK